MANDYAELLGLPSAESEAVAQILRPRQPSERQVFASPYQQSYADYSREAQDRIAQRDDLAEQAEIQRRIALPTVLGHKARQVAWQKALENAAYEKQLSELVGDLNKLDPADPEALSMQDEVIGKHPIARRALSDPRVAHLVKRQASENEEMQSIFEKDAEARQEYAALRASNTDPKTARQTVKDNAIKRQEKIAFALAGGDPNEFERFLTPDGRLDRAKLAFSIGQLKRAPSQQMSALEAKQLAEAAESIGVPKNPDDPTAKESVFKKAFGRKPSTAEDWQQAYMLVKDGIDPRREEVAAIVRDLEAQGKIVPNRFKEMAGVSSNVNIPRGTIPAPVQPGNLAAFDRKVLQNPDGTSSTASTISIGTDKGEVLIPTVIDGVRLSEQQAIDHYKKTGQHFGIFRTPQEANAFAADLHNRMEASAKPSPSPRVRVTTQAEYDALPPGTKAEDGRGRPFTKK